MKFRNWHLHRTGAEIRAKLYDLGSWRVRPAMDHYRAFPREQEPPRTGRIELHLNRTDEERSALLIMDPLEAVDLVGDLLTQLKWLSDRGVSIPGLDKDPHENADDTWPAGSVNAFRKRCGLSWREIAEKCQVHLTTAQRWSGIKPSEPDLMSKIRLSELADHYQVEIPMREVAL